VLRSLGFALLQAQRLDEAADVFAKLVRLRPTDADAANALAYTYAIAGDSLHTATRLAERAMRDSSALRPYALDTLGWIQYRQGRLDAALAALTEAASTLPSSDEGMLAENAYHQAWVLMELGRTEEARAAAERSRQDAAHRFWERDLRALESRLGIGPRS
jgi:Flp pilus assembly protein TadD